MSEVRDVEGLGKKRKTLDERIWEDSWTMMQTQRTSDSNHMCWTHTYHGPSMWNKGALPTLPPLPTGLSSQTGPPGCPTDTSNSLRSRPTSFVSLIPIRASRTTTSLEFPITSFRTQQSETGSVTVRCWARPEAQAPVSIENFDISCSVKFGGIHLSS